MSETERALVVAGIAAMATVSAAIIAAVASYLATKRDRRRILYGEALKAALGWKEMLHRVRRRTKDNEGQIVELFHGLQESILYYEGWIASESRYMARSYRRLVQTVKIETEPLIQEAWSQSIRPAPGNAIDSDIHPNFSRASDDFMKDVRSYLSVWQLRKLAVFWRNREDVER